MSTISNNSIFIIKPYKWNSTWVFDDEKVNLSKEPFVFGMPLIIDLFTKDIPNAEEGFRCLFSSSPFPFNTLTLIKENSVNGGTWYSVENSLELFGRETLKGWLCPALFKYYNEAPDKLFIYVESLS